MIRAYFMNLDDPVEELRDFRWTVDFDHEATHLYEYDPNSWDVTPSERVKNWLYEQGIDYRFTMRRFSGGEPHPLLDWGDYRKANACICFRNDRDATLFTLFFG